MSEKLIRKETKDERLARGMDTQAMIPVLAAIFEIVSICFLPWFSVPALKYTVHPHSATLFALREMQEGIGVKYELPSVVTEAAKQFSVWLMAGAAVGVLLLLIFICCAYRWKMKAALLGKLAFAWNGLLPLAAFWLCMDTNMMLNMKKGVGNHFRTLTVDSTMQLTSFPYAQILIGIFLFFSVKKLLDTRQEYEAKYYMTHSEQNDGKLSKRTMLGFLLIALAIPAVIAFGILFLNDRSTYFIALSIILISMLPFFMVFENRRPQAREVVIIAVMAALAVVGRVAFFMVPFFKPTAAVIIIAGISLGAEAGFLTGALSGFVSNFFFGQGPWTPWQMFAFGIIGFLSGLIFRKKKHGNKFFEAELCIYGFLATLLIYGTIMDGSALISGMNGLGAKKLTALLVSGFPVNMVHATATAVFLRILGKPMIRKLERVKIKYGMMEP